MKTEPQRQRHQYHVRVQPQDCTEDVVHAVITTQDHGQVSTTHVFLRRANLARPLCDILMGEEHKPSHRMAVGAVFMATGVTLAKCCGGIHYALAEYMGDLVGYAIHGLGLVPFIEHLADRVKAKRTY